MARYQTWPASLQTARLMFHIAPNLKVGPVLSNGDQQLLEEDTGYWVAKTQYDIAEETEVRVYNAAIAKAAGGVRGFILPCTRTILTAPWPAGTGVSTIQGVVTLDSDRTLADGVTLVRRVIDIRFRGAVAAGATTAELWAVKASTIRQGQDFSYTDADGAQRMATIIDPPVQVDTRMGRPVFAVNFRPAARTAIVAYSQADFEAPGCVMRLDDPMTGQMDIESYLTSHPEIVWREYFP